MHFSLALLNLYINCNALFLLTHSLWYSANSEMKSCLFDIIQSLVPSRSYMTMKGEAFYEYLSSLGHIARSEASRLSASIDKIKGRRYIIVMLELPNLFNLYSTLPRVNLIKLIIQDTSFSKLLERWFTNVVSRRNFIAGSV